MAERKEMQCKVAKEISAYIPQRTRVLNLDVPEYTFLCNFLPPEDRVFVYFFTYALPLDLLNKHLDIVDYTLRSEGFSLHTPATLMTPKTVSVDEAAVLEIIQSKGFTKLYTTSNGIEIWKKD
jgi:hypothetical protein